MNLYNKYRPTNFVDLYGDYSHIPKLIDKGAMSFIFHSDIPGTGKTSCARIVANYIGANGIDYIEINMADKNGVDTVRGLIDTISYRPFGRNRIVIMDEVHRGTSAMFDILLKPLEENPNRTYFILCTTEINKVPAAVKSRCTSIHFSGVADKDLTGLLDAVCINEDKKVHPQVLSKIVEHSNMSGRNALVLLEKVFAVEPQNALDVISNETIESSNAYELCKAIYRGEIWSEISEKLKGLKDSDAEGVRRLIISYGTTLLLNSNNRGAIMKYFTENTFNNGMSDLILMCYNAVNRK